MSSTFDTMQQALTWLRDKIPPGDTGQVEDVIRFFSETVDALHDHSHATNDAPNRAAGSEARLLRTALLHKGDERRAFWLKLKQTEQDKREEP